MNFFSKYKRIFFIISFMLFTILIGYWMYSVFFRKNLPSAPMTEEQASTTSGGLPASDARSGQTITPKEKTGLPQDRPLKEIEADPKAVGGLTQVQEVGNAKSSGLAVNANGSGVQYYNKEDGRFYGINKNGEIETMSEQVFHSVENVTWSPKKNKAVLEYPDGTNTIYDFDDDKQITMPSHWQDFDFSANGDKIIMESIGIDPENRWLAVVNEDGTKAQKIENIGKNDKTVYPSWSPNNQTVAMYTKGVDFDRQEVYFIGLNDENFKSTTIEGRDFRHQWSPKGDYLLYSVYSSGNDMKPMLWTVNAQGEKIGSGRKSLGIETWADKCAFNSSTEVYCAVPETLEKGAGLFPEMSQTTKDKLYKIDPTTGQKKLVAIPDGDFNISNMVVSENGSDLYFTDTATEKIYKINLK